MSWPEFVAHAAFVWAAFGVGWWMQRPKKIRDVPDIGTSSRYRIELTGGRILRTGDSGVASRIVNMERGARRKGRLYLDGKLINEW